MPNALNLQQLDQEQALNLCKFTLKSNGNILLIGRRGTGKTHIALQAAKELKLNLNYLNLSTLERSDILGFPLLNDPGDTVKYKSPYYLPALKAGEKSNTVLLLDEIDKAPPEVTAPLLELLQFRTINGTPVNVSACVLTGNLVDEGAYSNVISTAILDRCSKYILQFQFDKWLDWARLNEVHELILGFLKTNSDLTCGKINDLSYASPSPRAWTLASDALYKARLSKIVDIETISNIVCGFVGYDSGLKFKIWYEHYRKFESHVQSIIDCCEMAIDWKLLQPTEKIVFTISACQLAKNKILDSKNKKVDKCHYLNNLCDFFIKYKVDKEIQIMALHNSFNFDFVAKHKLYECQKFFDVFSKLNETVSIKK